MHIFKKVLINENVGVFKKLLKLLLKVIRIILLYIYMDNERKKEPLPYPTCMSLVSYSISSAGWKTTQGKGGLNPYVQNLLTERNKKIIQLIHQLFFKVLDIIRRYINIDNGKRIKPLPYPVYMRLITQFYSFTPLIIKLKDACQIKTVISATWYMFALLGEHVTTITY